MADISGVEKALVALIAGALFGGTSYLSGEPQESLTAGMVRLYRGWPNATGLDADLVAGMSHVSIFPRPGMARDTTRMLAEWTVPLTVAPTVTLAVSGATVTLGGTAAAANVIGILAGTGDNPSPYSYRLTATDTVGSAATALGTQIPGATVSGAVITMPNVNFTVANGMDQTAGREVRRQVQDFQVSCFAPAPLTRDTLCSAVDLVCAQQTRFMLPDGWNVMLRYHGTRVDDRPQKDRVWRRDLFCAIEYPTVETQIVPAMLFGIDTIAAGNGATLIYTV